MEFMGITSFGSITVICYLAAEVIKRTPINNKWIPIICGALGGILGVVSMCTISGFPANDYITAVAIGIVSGLAATGVNQVYKQLTVPTTSSATSKTKSK